MGFLLVLGGHASCTRCFPGVSVLKESACNAGGSGVTDLFPGLGRSSGDEYGDPPSILVGRIPGTEEPDELKSTGPQSRTQLKGQCARKIQLLKIAFPSALGPP